MKLLMSILIMKKKSCELGIKYYIESKKMVVKLKKNNIDKIIIYGAGQVGRSLIKLANISAIEVVSIVDKNESKWGKNILDVKVNSIDQAFLKKCNNFIIASFSYKNEIRNTIEQKANYYKFVDLNIFEMEN